MLALAPIVKAFTRLRLDLFSRVEDWWLVRLRLRHDVRLGALRSLLGLHSGASVGLIVKRSVFGIVRHIVLHQHRVGLIGDILKVIAIAFSLLHLILTMGVLLLAQFHRLNSVRLIRFDS